MNIAKATAADFLGLFAGQADAFPSSPPAWRDRAEDLAAFLAAHEESLPDTASHTLLVQVGGLLILQAERLDRERVA